MTPWSIGCAIEVVFGGRKHISIAFKQPILNHKLPKGKTGRFAKIVFYFLRACDSNTCSGEIVGKANDQGDGKMKVPCKLYFGAEDSFINILKEQLPKTL